MRSYLIFGVFLGGLAAVALLAWSYLGRDGEAARVARAQREGGVVEVYANVDAGAVAPLIAAFERRGAGVTVRYHDLSADALDARFRREADAGKVGADIVWSSAMAMQAKLVNDGYAQTYASPEKDALPAEAVWNDQSYRITAEPVAIAYNREQVAQQELARTHAAFAQMLRARRADLTGRVATYDPARSGIGYLFLTQDLAATRDTQALLEALGATRPVLMETTGAMLDAVARGDVMYAYNVVGPYAEERAKADPHIGVLYPEDYSIVASRVAFVARGAPHPAAARLFLDFLLSREGQDILARAGLPPVRGDVAAPRLAPGQARAIPGGPRLFVNLDPIKRQRVLDTWNAALAQGKSP
ncbi:ABC transporter substrate-binding protein [Novosphingobium decolorationis]|uniref:ABC transporter substrate-binding protein n=1 Tax=Novosphingobium decolorationis TaxID=2698673 RepID=A0ABX8E6D3_9SPHN|nr:ABC transporter substrate-binding protein [Novosphingobium decolorationis]QVM84752.1 ABC transporter substrate-binding protein [Novosphingobium decolorationis]